MPPGIFCFTKLCVETTFTISAAELTSLAGDWWSSGANLETEEGHRSKPYPKWLD